MQNIGKNTRKHIVGGGVMFALLALLFAAPPAAQSQIVTPLPGPAATATAAAQGMAQAQAQQRQGEQAINAANDYRARANQLETQGQNQIDQGIASYNAAVDNGRNALAELNAQRYDAASEMLTRMQSNLDSVKTQLDAARESMSEMKTIIDTQASTNISLTNRLQVAETRITTISNAYSAKLAQDETDGRNGTVINIFVGLLIFIVILLLLALVASVISRRNNSNGVTVIDAETEVIEGEDDGQN
jgi:hypothetical protein